jgi:hypothetical protein
LPRCQVECCAQRIVSQAEGHIGCRTFLHHSCGHRILDRWLMRRIPSTHRQGMVSGPSSQRQEAQRKPAPLSPGYPNPTWPYKAFPCITSVRSVASLAIAREWKASRTIPVWPGGCQVLGIMMWSVSDVGIYVGSASLCLPSPRLGLYHHRPQMLEWYRARHL